MPHPITNKIDYPRKKRPKLFFFCIFRGGDTSIYIFISCLTPFLFSMQGI